MYCWENIFEKIVVKIRGKEMRYQGLFFFVTAISFTITMLGPTVMLLMSTSFFVTFGKMSLNPQLIVLAMVNWL